VKLLFDLRLKFGLILSLVSICIGCGNGDFRGGSLISLFDSDSFEQINEELTLPEEFILDGIQAVEDSDFRSLKGVWGRGFMIHTFSPQAYPRIDDGAIEVNMNYIPPSRFKLSFFFRSNGSSSFFTEVYSNQIKIYRKSSGKTYLIAGQPIRFVPEHNVLRIYFCDDTIASSFNGKEFFRSRDKDFAGKGFFNSASINSAGNLGTRTFIRYFSLADKDLIRKYSKVFNILYGVETDGSVEKYIRRVRIGDSTMPSILVPSPSRLVIPITIPKFADLRFSTATLPFLNTSDTLVRYTVDFIEKGTDKVINLFNEAEKPANLFDQKWTSCRIDLNDYQKKKGNLVFSVGVEKKGKKVENGVIALWGAPRILITPKRADTRNVILITIENFGIESLRMKSDLRPLTPSILNWAEDSVVFENAYPVSVWPSASLFSILYGNSEVVGEYMQWIEDSCKPENKFGQSLSSIFSENGYDTAAFYQGINCQPFLGLTGGFNECINDNKFPGSEWDITNPDKLAGRAALWVEQRKNKNCFIHIHFNGLSKIDIESLMRDIKDERNLIWEFWQTYGSSLALEDGNVGKMLRSLWKVGALKNALIVIAGTDGIDIPSATDISRETVIGKDQYLRSFVLFNIQSKFPPTGNRKKMILLSDIYSTILDYMNMKNPEAGNSASFLKTAETEEESEPENRIAVTALSDPKNSHLGYALSEGKFKALFVNQNGKTSYSVYFFDLSKDSNERSPLTKADIKNEKISAEFDDKAKELLDAKPLFSKEMKTIKHYLNLLANASTM
jgi:arylsulfatase A-like enzyme